MLTKHNQYQRVEIWPKDLTMTRRTPGSLIERSSPATLVVYLPNALSLGVLSADCGMLKRKEDTCQKSANKDEQVAEEQLQHAMQQTVNIQHNCCSTRCC
jgi:hypothetical protein